MIPYEEIEILHSFKGERSQSGKPGACGKVVKGLWNEKLVAVKLMHEISVKDFGEGAKMLNEEKKKELLKEAENYSKLDHPSIIKFYGMTRVGNCVHIVVEYVKGGSLQELIDRNAQKIELLEAITKIQIALDIAVGVNYLHVDRKMVHRDLKPLNVLICDGYRAKLCDFGTARDVGNITLQNVATALYAAPEVFEAGNEKKKGSFKSDVFSYGVTLWCLYFERRPPGLGGFPPNLIPTVAGATKTAKIVNGIVKDCCKVDPGRRSNMKEVVGNLERMLEELRRKKYSLAVKQISILEKEKSKCAKREAALNSRIAKLKKRLENQNQVMKLKEEVFRKTVKDLEKTNTDLKKLRRAEVKEFKTRIKEYEMKYAKKFPTLKNSPIMQKRKTFYDILLSTFKTYDSKDEFEREKFCRNPIDYLVDMIYRADVRNSRFAKYEQAIRNLILAQNSCVLEGDERIIEHMGIGSGECKEWFNSVQMDSHIGSPILTNFGIIFFYENFVVKKIFGLNSKEVEVMKELHEKGSEKNIIHFKGYFKTNYSICIFFSKYDYDLTQYIKKLHYDHECIISRMQIDGSGVEGKSITSRDVESRVELEKMNKGELLRFLERALKLCKYYIALETLKSIKHIHAKEFIHKDIKPGNFFVRSQSKYFDMLPRIVLGDLGSCKAEREYKEGNIFELIGVTYITNVQEAFLNDIYCFGITFHYILTGTILQRFASPKMGFSKDMEVFKKIKPMAEWSEENLKAHLAHSEVFKNCSNRMKNILFSCYFILEHAGKLKTSQRALLVELFYREIKKEYMGQLEMFIRRYEQGKKCKKFESLFEQYLAAWEVREESDNLEDKFYLGISRELEELSGRKGRGSGKLKRNEQKSNLELSPLIFKKLKREYEKLTSKGSALFMDESDCDSKEKETVEVEKVLKELRELVLSKIDFRKVKQKPKSKREYYSV